MRLTKCCIHRSCHFSIGGISYRGIDRSSSLCRKNDRALKRPFSCFNVSRINCPKERKRPDQGAFLLIILVIITVAVVIFSITIDVQFNGALRSVNQFVFKFELPHIRLVNAELIKYALDESQRLTRG